MILLARLFSRLPLRILYILSDILAFLLWHVINYRKELVLSNLTNSFPDKSPREIKALAREYYKHMSDILFETIKSLTISPEELRRRVTFTNMEILEEYKAQNTSVFLHTMHWGNWELLLLSGCVQLPYIIDTVYKPLSHKRFDEMIFKSRSRFGGRPMAMKDTMREILKRKEDLRAYALCADQAPDPRSKKYWGKIFNQDTAFYYGPELLPKFTKFPVVFIATERIRRGYYKAEIQKFAEPPYAKDSHELMEKYIAKVEEMVRRDPAAWLWSHNRWKHQREEMDEKSPSN